MARMSEASRKIKIARVALNRAIDMIGIAFQALRESREVDNARADREIKEALEGVLRADAACRDAKDDILQAFDEETNLD